jgi:hypothetical protein
MAENSPHVNDRIELLVANTKGHAWIHDKVPVAGEWSLPRMRELFFKYGPRDTEALDLSV